MHGGVEYAFPGEREPRSLHCAELRISKRFQYRDPTLPERSPLSVPPVPCPSSRITIVILENSHEMGPGFECVTQPIARWGGLDRGTRSPPNPAQRPTGA